MYNSTNMNSGQVLKMSEIEDKLPPFLPISEGNPWRYKKGQSGRVIKYTYKSMRKMLIEYIQRQIDSDKPYTWSGLALYLGISRPALDLYWKGQNKTADPEIEAMLNYFRSAMESQLEEKLQREKGAVNGIIYALNNQFGDAWKTEKNININQDVKESISIVIDPGSGLAQRLRQSGVTIEQLPEGDK